MRPQPPEPLVQLLDRLGLATSEQVASVRGRVQRLAHKLPLFESVWVDALQQARMLTPYQAVEINAGRGTALQVGPYVLVQRLAHGGFADVFEAREIATRQSVRLQVASLPPIDRKELSKSLRTVTEAAEHLRETSLLPVENAGVDESSEPPQLWAATAWVKATTAADWMVASGRFPPESVLEIARQTAASLAELERLELLHGDLCASGLLIDSQGDVHLPHAGMRPILRREEGYGFADLVPEAYDYLAPERVIEGTPPTTASELYACGCLWWHLLTGRPPLGGGDSLTRIHSVHAAKIVDVERFAPEAPMPLAAAIREMTEVDPARRIDSFATLASRLGPPTVNGRQSLAASIRRSQPRSRHFQVSRSKLPGPKLPRPNILRFKLPNSAATRTWFAATAGCLLAAILILWPFWKSMLLPPTANLPTDTPAAPAHSHGLSDVPQEAGLERQGEQRTDRSTAATAANDESVLLLPTDRPIDLSSLRLRPGLVVRGLGGERPQFYVPSQGLGIDVEDVRFEKADFLWKPDMKSSRPVPAGQPAQVPVQMIDARCRRIEFRGCSFQAGAGSSVVAVNWSRAIHSEETYGSSLEELVISDCVFHQVDAVVAMQNSSGRTLDFSGSLFLGPGPLVRLASCPRLEEPLSINLTHVTLRGASAVLECRYARIYDEPGKISITASNSVFAPGVEGALLEFRGEHTPSRLLQVVEWNGQGSLLSTDAAMAKWLTSQGQPKNVDDADLAVDGLARSQLEFAGSEMLQPAAAQITRWSAPLRTTATPGIDPQRLFLSQP